MLFVNDNANDAVNVVDVNDVNNANNAKANDDRSRKKKDYVSTLVSIESSNS
jgi:hypothetical protein